jgi:peptide/nickel transport system ATP-binding protein
VHQPWPQPETVTVALENVRFELTPGTTLGVVGESGSGKSTLARLALGLLQPTAGVVSFDGRSLASMSGTEMRAFRRTVQPVFQDPRSALNPKLSLAAIVTEPLLNYGVGNRDTRRGKASELLEHVRLSPRLLDRRPPDVSGGQLQRIAIARALSLDPTYLICDEPLSALDVSVQAGIMNLLMDLQTSRKLAMMFISHDLGRVRHISDYVLVMHRGHVVEEGPADTIYSDPKHEYTRTLMGVGQAPAS